MILTFPRLGSRFSPWCITVSATHMSMEADSSVWHVLTYSAEGTRISVFCCASYSRLQEKGEHVTGELVSQENWSSLSSCFYLLLNALVDPHLTYVCCNICFTLWTITLGKAKLNNTVQRFSEPSFILVCIVQGRVRGGGSKTCLITIFLVYLCVCVWYVCVMCMCVWVRVHVLNL